MWWKDEAKIFGHGVVRRYGPVNWGSRRKSHLIAEIVLPTAAESAALTWDARLDGYAIAHFDSLDLSPASNDDTSGFVAKYEWFAHNERANLAMLPVVDLRRTLSISWIHDGLDWILVYCTSLPHIPVAMILTSTCLLVGNTGVGRVPWANSPFRRRTKT